jgi:hypothetical protein
MNWGRRRQRYMKGKTRDPNEHRELHDQILQVMNRDSSRKLVMLVPLMLGFD